MNKEERIKLFESLDDIKKIRLDVGLSRDYQFTDTLVLTLFLFSLFMFVGLGFFMISHIFYFLFMDLVVGVAGLIIFFIFIAYKYRMLKRIEEYLLKYGKRND